MKFIKKFFKKQYTNVLIQFGFFITNMKERLGTRSLCKEYE